MDNTAFIIKGFVFVALASLVVALAGDGVLWNMRRVGVLNLVKARIMRLTGSIGRRAKKERTVRVIK